MRERFSGPWVLCLLVACLAAFPSCAAAQTFTFAGYGTVQTGLVPEDIATGDLDSDGDLDIAAGNTNAGETGAPDTVSVLLNRGDGTFLPRSDHAAGDRPEGLTLGDLDGDGDLDIATADYNSSGVSVLLGDGAGSFSRGSTVAVSGRPRGIVAGDLDADGDLDIATANYDGNSVSVLRGAGDGSFALLATAAVGRRPEAIAKGRLNADGALDLATCDVNDDTVTPLLGNGDGTFARAAAAAVGDRPRHLRLADLDSDGLDDVLTADNGTSKVTVLRNAGGASFLSQGTLSIAGMAGDVYVASGDMNLDGWLDGLVSFASSDKVGVFPGAGGFLFGPGETVPAGDSPVGIAVADLDGDGRVDLAVANALDDNLHVYLGASSPGLVVLDNGQAGTSSVGTWSVSSSPNPYGASSLFAKGTQARYAWSVGLPWPGTYSAYSWWTQSSGRAKAVPYALTHATGTSTVTADQTRDGGRWNLLATRSFGAATVVEVRSTSTTLSTCADAVAFLPLLPSNAPPAAQIVSIAPDPASLGELVAFSGAGSDADGSVTRHRWRSSIDGALSGDASFATSALSAGTHTIYLEIQDDQGLWSGEVSETLEVGASGPVPLILDNGQPGTSSTGTWSVSGASGPYGASSLYAKNGPTYTYTFQLPSPGAYEASAWWTSYSSRSTSVPVAIQHAAGSTTVTVNQQVNGGQWNVLGIFDFGATAVVKVTAVGTASTCADAVRLVAAGTPTGDIIVDNGGPGTSSTGTWSTSGAPSPYGASSLYAKNGPTYTFAAAANGQYRVHAWWTQLSTRSSAVPIAIAHSGGTTTVTADQRTGGGQWNLLGTFTFSGQAAVTITAQGTQSTCADAVRLEPAP